MVKFALAIVAALAAGGCATLDAPRDNPAASPRQIVTAAMCRQAAADKVAVAVASSAKLESPQAACVGLAVASRASAANRREIDAAIALLDSDAASASADWGVIIDLVFTGLETGSEAISAEKNAQAALRKDIPAAELMSRFETAKGNYDAAKVLLDKAVSDCGG